MDSCLVNPIEGGRLLSGYGWRLGMQEHRPTFHAGLDFEGRAGTPVRAIADGVVVFTSLEGRARGGGGYGNQVGIHHPQLGPQEYSFYAHMQDAPLVTVGDVIEAGTPIGKVGSTTNGAFSPLPGESVAEWRERTGKRRVMIPHLHFEWRRGPRPPFPAGYGRTTVDPREAAFNRFPFCDPVHAPFDIIDPWESEIDSPDYSSVDVNAVPVIPNRRSGVIAAGAGLGLLGVVAVGTVLAAPVSCSAATSPGSSWPTADSVTKALPGG